MHDVRQFFTRAKASLDRLRSFFGRMSIDDLKENPSDVNQKKMSLERIYQELDTIAATVERLEVMVQALDEKAKMAMGIFKIIQQLELLPLPEIDLAKVFRTNEKGRWTET